MFKRVLLLLLFVATAVHAEEQSVPFTIRFTGNLRGVLGLPNRAPIGVTFALYKDQTGGAPLWIETQNVTLDSQIRFTVVLGSASQGGIPVNLFASGEGRWLGMTLNGGAEMARVMLTSVPYAFEAADAQTIRGHTPDEFVTQEQLRSNSAWVPRRCMNCVFTPSASTADHFEATTATGPSFVSAAGTGPPLQVQSTTLVPNLNVDLLHGLTDAAFAKLNSNNQFALTQQFNGGAFFSPINGSDNAPESSSALDFQAMGNSNAGLISQIFRWQGNGSDQNHSQPQFTLAFGSGGQPPQPTGFSFNSDGTMNFASGQTFPGTAIMTAIIPLLEADGFGGSQGTGNGGGISQTPTGNQNINQPPGTSTNVNNLNNTRTVQASDNWVIGNIAVPLVAGVQTTLTITCPVGVDTSDSPVLGGPNGGYPIRIIDGSQPNANSETTYVTGGYCASAGTTGTIIFTPYFSHAMSTYTIGSASQGIQEAINEACGTSTLVYLNSDCHVVIPPLTPLVGYDVYDTIYFHANGSLLSGYGAILNCHERAWCLQVGDLSSSNDYANNTIEGISFRAPDSRTSDPAFSGSLIQSTQRTGGTFTITTAAPHNFRTGDRVTQMFTDGTGYWGDVPSIVASDATHYTYARPGAPDLALQATPGVVALSYFPVLVNANSTSLVDLQYENTGEYGRFNHFFDFWDDENAQIIHFNNNAIPLNRNANWTGSFVWSGGSPNLPNGSQQLAPVITVSNSTFTANGSNCATVYNSNGFHFQNSTCQASGPWEFFVSNSTGNYQGADFQNIYSESSPGANPASPVWSPWAGLGIAGLIGGPTSAVGRYTLSGQGGFAGAMPTVGRGPTTYVYYLVAKDLTAGTQTSPLPFMYEQESSPGQVQVQWPRVASGQDTIVYDVIRNLASYGTIYVADGGYVAPYAGGCNGGSTSACGSVAIGLPQCNGFVCSFSDNTANATSAYNNIQNGNFVPNPTFWPGGAVLSSTALQSSSVEQAVIGIAFSGAPTQYANYCSGEGGNTSGGYTVCVGSPTPANNGVPDQAPLMLTDGIATTGGGGLPGAKGRLIFETTRTSNAAWHQIITLFDSNPAKTQATTGNRPEGDPGDMFLAVDPNNNLGIGGGAHGIAQFVNDNGGGKWGELLTSSLKTFQVPVQVPSINILTGIQLNGSNGIAGQCIMSTGTGITWGTPGTTPGAISPEFTSDIVPSRIAKVEALENSGPIGNSYVGAGKARSHPSATSAMQTNVESIPRSQSSLSAVPDGTELKMRCAKGNGSELICRIVP